MSRYQSTIRALAHARRRAFETLGSYRFSRTGAHGIDEKLEAHLDLDGGFFVEAGANDGVNFSNTYYLERARGWSGVLVEGIPDLYRACIRHRPRSRVFNCALVAPELEGELVTMHYSNLQSIVSGALPYEHVEAGLASQGERTYEIEVPGRTLSSLLDEVDPPRFALVEVLDDDARGPVEAALGERYEEVERLTPTDVLFRQRAM